MVGIGHDTKQMAQKETQSHWSSQQDYGAGMFPLSPIGAAAGTVVGVEEAVVEEAVAATGAVVLVAATEHIWGVHTVRQHTCVLPTSINSTIVIVAAHARKDHKHLKCSEEQQPTPREVEPNTHSMHVLCGGVVEPC